MLTTNDLRLFFTTTLIIAMSFGASAKDILERIDSAYQYCLSHPNDTDGLDVLNSGLNKIFGSQPDTAIFYYKELIRLTKDGKMKRLQGRGLNGMGICLEYLGMADSAISIYEMALEIALKTSDSSLIADTYNNLGIAYSLKGLYQTSIDYTLKALKIQEERNDSNGLATMYNNLGLRYSEIRNQQKAIDFYNKALELNAHLGNSHRLATNNVNLGRSYFLLENFDSSIVYYQQALEHGRSSKSEYNTSLAYSGLAYNYLNIKDLKNAKIYADSAKALAERMEIEMEKKSNILIQGYILKEQGKNEEALNNFLSFKDWAENNGRVLSSFSVYHEISDLYKALGNYPDALAYMKKFAFIKDTAFNEQKDLALEQISIYKQDKLENEKEILNKELIIKENSVQHERSLRNTFLIIGVLLILLVIGIFHRFLYERKTKQTLAEKNKIIQKEKDRSENLLLNILPEEVAEELKSNGVAEAKDFDEVTVILTDFIEFTKTTQKFTAKEVVEELNVCFKAFDEIITQCKLEKIKTIGDAYMAASGLNTPKKAGAIEAILAAIEMQNFMIERKAERSSKNLIYFEMRCGLNTGPVVAGIVGVKKFQYDIWGDTVNTASRMESACEKGKINISQSVYDLVHQNKLFTFEPRGKISAKGKGPIEMYYVSSKT